MIQGDLNRYLELESLHRFAGSPREFWDAFLQVAVRMEEAAGGQVLVRNQSGEKEPWRRIAQVATKISFSIPDARAQPLAEQCFQEGMAAASIGQEGGTPSTLLAIPLKTDDTVRDAVLLLLFPREEGQEVDSKASRLLLLADAPAVYRRNRQLLQTQADIAYFASTLDLIAVLHGQRKFVSACMTLCNELASRFQASQVGVGLLKDKYVRVRAISNLDEVKRKMEAVQRLEAAMEEALDQDDEIALPAGKENALVVRDSEAYLRQEEAGALATVPLRLKGQPMGAITLLREKTPFDEREIRALRVVADQAAPLIEHIRRRDRWFGARWAEDGREWLGMLWGVDHAWTKLAGVLTCVLLGVLFFGQMTYRVEAPFIMRTEVQAYLSAPFDGYIAEVFYETGDAVPAGAVVARCDDAELRVQEASLLADIRRFQSEAERARGTNDFAQMRVSRAQEEQARANLEQVLLHLHGAEIRTPFDALIVEDGKLRQRIGAPVQRGDTLLKVARADLLYAELRVKERDIDVIALGSSGRVAFASRPDLKFPATVERIEPVAMAQEEGGVFLTRAVFDVESEDWWRPGMTGVAKVDVGKRSIIWILTHRLIDFIRLKIWI